MQWTILQSNERRKTHVSGDREAARESSARQRYCNGAAPALDAWSNPYTWERTRQCYSRPGRREGLPARTVRSNPQRTLQRRCLRYTSHPFFPLAVRPDPTRVPLESLLRVATPSIPCQMDKRLRTPVGFYRSRPPGITWAKNRQN